MPTLKPLPGFALLIVRAREFSRLRLRFWWLSFSDVADQRPNALAGFRPRRESNPLIAVLRTAAFPFGYVAGSVIAFCGAFAALMSEKIDLPRE